MNARCCDQCGTSFVPRREHARFCSSRCRVAWNRQNTTAPGSEQSALDWSSTAMRDTLDRMLRKSAGSRPYGYVLISEAVWWVTIVDATLVRYFPDTYDAVLADLPAAERALTEGILGGLRFVRNQMGYYADHGDFVAPPRGPGAALGEGTPAAAATALADWRWLLLPEPAVAWLPPLRQEWEMTRYHSYQACLAGRTMGETFGRAAQFLNTAAGQSALAGRGGLDE